MNAFRENISHKENDSKSFVADFNISVKPWNRDSKPKRILAIRLQAMGDVVISLPYLQYLRNSLPELERFDLLTREEDAGIPLSLELFDEVIPLSGGRNHKWQLFHSFLLVPRLWMRRYDIVLDLQNNRISKIIRMGLRPKAWSVFDRFSPNAAGERNRKTIEALGLGPNEAEVHLHLRNPGIGKDILLANGWKQNEALIILNPAGAFETRNWEVENYIGFAKLFIEQFPNCRFVVVGTGLIAAKAKQIQEALGTRLINLVGKTTPPEAFAVIQHATLALSEDSGLMHMCWVSGIPTLALFGSTRSDWSRPLGSHSVLLDSSDLPCGNCMQEFCKFGDVHCLTRYTPLHVFQTAMDLLENTNRNNSSALKMLSHDRQAQ